MHAGVDKRSVDTWMHPTLFHMQYSTGAPPDMFDAGGQNWGFPTYNWEEMAKDSYQWWRRRLTTLSECALKSGRPACLHAQGSAWHSACTALPAGVPPRVVGAEGDQASFQVPGHA